MKKKLKTSSEAPDLNNKTSTPKKSYFKYKVGLRKKDKKKIIEQFLNEGVLSSNEIENVIKESKDFIKNRKKCYICGMKENIKICSICKNFFYCSKEHQLNDWSDHKVVCKLYRYCYEDRELYIEYDKSQKQIDFIFPIKRLKLKIVDKIEKWDEYFFKLRKEHFSRLSKMVKKKYQVNEENSLKREFIDWERYPEFRIVTDKLSFSLSIYHVLQVFKTKVRNQVLSIIIPYIGPSKVDLLETVKELCLLLYNVKSLGITFIGLNVPCKEELSTVTYESLPNCATYFWKKKYDVLSMTSVDKPNLVVLGAKGLLYERLQPLYDLLLKEINVVIFFNTKKYFEITRKLLKEILKVKIYREGLNPFRSFEYTDPCKKINEEQFVSENRYYICCSHVITEGEKKKMEARYFDYLKSIVTKKMGINEIYIYLVAMKWGFAKLKTTNEKKIIK